MFESLQRLVHFVGPLQWNSSSRIEQQYPFLIRIGKLLLSNNPWTFTMLADPLSLWQVATP